MNTNVRRSPFVTFLLTLNIFSAQIYAIDANIPSILMWTKLWGKANPDSILRERFHNETCSKQCNFVSRSNMKRATDYEAIIFESVSVDNRDLPETRSAHQQYFMFSVEPPGYRGEEKVRALRPHFFNGTIGYSHLNDYVFDYDYTASPGLNLTDEFVQHKTESVLGVISHCETNSGREEIINELRKYINMTLREAVQFSGRCYEQRLKNDEYGQMIKSHRFILALENNVCSEYVSEKGFRYKELIVPIVLSRRIAEEVLPSDAFIAIDDFNSLSDLADELKRLQENDEEYMKYFAWFHRKYAHGVKRKGICQLCMDLHKHTQSHKSLIRAVYPDNGMCIPSRMHPLSFLLPFFENHRNSRIGAVVCLMLLLLSYGVRSSRA